MTRPFQFKREPLDELRIEPRTPDEVRKYVAHSSSELTAGSEWPSDSNTLTSNPVFDLLGTAAQLQSVNVGAESPGPFENRADDPLINSLFEQYCQALASPLSAHKYDWVAAPEANEQLSPENGAGESRWHNAGTNPVASVLGDINTVEQAFGVLHQAETTEVARKDDIPEILRLFAPPEYQLVLLNRANTPPPTLVRREHHTLSIDSPIRPLNADYTTVKEQTE
jgi:hypothetical protein